MFSEEELKILYLCIGDTKFDEVIEINKKHKCFDNFELNLKENPIFSLFSKLELILKEKGVDVN